MTTAAGAAVPKYRRVAAAIKRQIADGTLRPGQPAPSGAELSRAFGFSTLTCRKALRALIAEGLLVPGPTPTPDPGWPTRTLPTSTGISPTPPARCRPALPPGGMRRA